MTHWFLILILTFIGLNSMADDKIKPLKKKNIPIKIESKDTLKSKSTSVDDTLVFEKTLDDTLIFADDEIGHKYVKPKARNEISGISMGSRPKILEAWNPVIYPNPSFGHSHIAMNTTDSSTSEITILSLDGVMIRKDVIEGNTYEINDLSTGTYIVTIKCGTQIIQKRLFVK